MNLPRPSSSGKLGAWTREGQQNIWHYCISMNSLADDRETYSAAS